MQSRKLVCLVGAMMTGACLIVGVLLFPFHYDTDVKVVAYSGMEAADLAFTVNLEGRPITRAEILGAFCQNMADLPKGSESIVAVTGHFYSDGECETWVASWENGKIVGLQKLSSGRIQTVDSYKRDPFEIDSSETQPPP